MAPQNERKITEFQEKVLRLVHHDFEGLTQDEAAKQLQTSQSVISKALQDIEVKLPRFFPILSKRQKQIYDLITKRGFTHKEVADVMKVSVPVVEQIVGQLIDKGVRFLHKPETKQYRPFMDNKVREKF